MPTCLPFSARAAQVLLATLAVALGWTPLDGQTSNAHPDVSPDGRFIVFDSDRTGNGDIYVMNADGSDARRLTDHPAMEMGAQWWGSSQAVAFARYEGGPLPTWYVMDADGASVRELEEPQRIH